MRKKWIAGVLTTGALALGCPHGPELAPTGAGGAAAPTVGMGIAALHRQAVAVQPLLKSLVAHEYLGGIPQLPPIVPRPLGPGGAPVDELTYYSGRAEDPSGSPIFYAYLLDVAMGRGAERASLIGRRMVDLSGAGLGVVRLLAGAGVDAMGVFGDPQARLLYSQPSDQGVVPLYGREVTGRVSLAFGAFPTDAATVAAVSYGYDLAISRNALKRGLVRPADAPAGAPSLLGLPDEEYLKRLWTLLKPGGRMLVYNLCPAPNPVGGPSNPGADCRSPFSQAQWQGAGFRVRDFDRSDTPDVRTVAKALGWDQGAGRIDVDTNLFAIYTLVERP